MTEEENLKEQLYSVSEELKSLKGDTNKKLDMLATKMIEFRDNLTKHIASTAIHDDVLKNAPQLTTQIAIAQQNLEKVQKKIEGELDNKFNNLNANTLKKIQLIYDVADLMGPALERLDESTRKIDALENEIKYLKEMVIVPDEEKIMKDVNFIKKNFLPRGRY